MKNSKDSPGVFIPPPLIYAGFFLLSFLIQGYLTIKAAFFFHSRAANIAGLLIIFTGLAFILPALRQFFQTKNTVALIKPATSLQTSGIYSLTRNPMYVGLSLIYLGMALIFGNWWTLILFPVLLATVHFRVIRPEEKYLSRAFGDHYTEYKNKVRRWI
jgi:protein-S-isoprenylcysteine O-methyltransferase Ste14